MCDHWRIIEVYKGHEHWIEVMLLKAWILDQALLRSRNEGYLKASKIVLNTKKQRPLSSQAVETLE